MGEREARKGNFRPKFFVSSGPILACREGRYQLFVTRWHQVDAGVSIGRFRLCF